MKTLSRPNIKQVYVMGVLHGEKTALACEAHACLRRECGGNVYIFVSNIGQAVVKF